jgi:hypothetical protein
LTVYVVISVLLKRRSMTLFAPRAPISSRRRSHPQATPHVRQAAMAKVVVVVVVVVCAADAVDVVPRVDARQRSWSACSKIAKTSSGCDSRADKIHSQRNKVIVAAAHRRTC